MVVYTRSHSPTRKFLKRTRLSSCPSLKPSCVDERTCVKAGIYLRASNVHTRIHVRKTLCFVCYPCVVACAKVSGRAWIHFFFDPEGPPTLPPERARSLRAALFFPARRRRGNGGTSRRLRAGKKRARVGARATRWKQVGGWAPLDPGPATKIGKRSAHARKNGTTPALVHVFGLVCVPFSDFGVNFAHASVASEQN